MRLGCGGCLILLALVALLGGLGWAGVQALREPEMPAIDATMADGLRAQQKIFEIARRGARGGDRSKGAEPVALSERELNAFFSRHLGEIVELPVSDIGLRLPGAGTAEFRARLPLRQLVTEAPLSVVGRHLPAAWLERRVWLRLDVRPRIESGPTRRRHLRLDVGAFAVGRQRLPTVLLRVLLDPGALRVLRWPVPDGVEAVTVESGRVVVRTAS